MESLDIDVQLNGRKVSGRVPAHWTLLQFLRDELHATEVKYGCGEGVCGACGVLIDGEAVNSCLTLAAQVQGRRITTVRGLAENGEMHPLQEAFVAAGAVQCGYCTPGILMTLSDFLEREPHPDTDAVRHALAGNLCRCTGYAKILEAVETFVRGQA